MKSNLGILVCSISFERKPNIAYKKSKNLSNNQVNTVISQFNKSLTSLTGSFELNGLVST